MKKGQPRTWNHHILRIPFLLSSVLIVLVGHILPVFILYACQGNKTQF